MSTLFHIKNMVCDRCKHVVKTAFEKAGAQITRVALGEIETSSTLSSSQLKSLNETLHSFGFEILDDKASRTVEKIKTLLLELIHHQSIVSPKINYSDYLSEALHRDYSGLSSMFSSQEGITIEQYIIRQKIERVKELLMYDEQSLSQIADTLQYSSVAHLSTQFKKVTGLTPSQYKQSAVNQRQSLDLVSKNM